LLGHADTLGRRGSRLRQVRGGFRQRLQAPQGVEVVPRPVSLSRRPCDARA